MIQRSNLFSGLFGAAMLLSLAGMAKAQEQTLVNDAFPSPLPDEPPEGGYLVAVQAGFVPGEKAAAIFTIPANMRPCRVKRVQIFWASTTGTTGNSIQEAIEVWRGSVIDSSTSPVRIFDSLNADPDGFSPQLTDGYLNEFDLNSFGIIVPATSTKFCVALVIGTETSPTNGPGPCCDQPPPIPGCIPSRNAIYGTFPPFINSAQWFSPCQFGMSGDFFIRAVIEKYVAPVVPLCTADIADDQGTPLFAPGRDPLVPNTGLNEGDYNAFFQGFFDALAYCNFADDQGTALTDPNRDPLVPNTGVNEGDYNYFFQVFFAPCP